MRVLLCWLMRLVAAPVFVAAVLLILALLACDEIARRATGRGLM